ncbi:chaperonin 60 subunit alpha 2, chloroplastic-like protein [Tanacetum coccineum]
MGPKHYGVCTEASVVLSEVIINDGLMIAKAIDLYDSIENAGANASPRDLTDDSLIQTLVVVWDCLEYVAAHAHTQVVAQARSKAQAKATAHAQDQMVVMALVGLSCDTLRNEKDSKQGIGAPSRDTIGETHGI